MPELKVIYCNVPEIVERTGHRKYHDDVALDTVIDYCLNPDKTPHGFVGAYGVNQHQAAFEMELLAEAFGKNRGLRLRHFILSFSPQEAQVLGEHVYETLDEVARVVAGYYASDYQIIYAVHENTENPHIHFVMNTVSYINGKKYGGKKRDYYQFLNYVHTYLYRRFRFRLIAVSDNG